MLSHNYQGFYLFRFLSIQEKKKIKSKVLKRLNVFFLIMMRNDFLLYSSSKIDSIEIADDTRNINEGK
jgi:hypothetical protein